MSEGGTGLPDWVKQVLLRSYLAASRMRQAVLLAKI